MASISVTGLALPPRFCAARSHSQTTGISELLESRAVAVRLGDEQLDNRGRELKPYALSNHVPGTWAEYTQVR